MVYKKQNNSSLGFFIFTCTVRLCFFLSFILSVVCVFVFFFFVIEKFQTD